MSHLSLVPTYPCSMPGCGAMIPQDKSRCPKCKEWQIRGSTAVEDEETVLLSDARVSHIERLSIGMLNEVFGGGLARTSVNLVAGPPGAGKTTLFLQLADICAEVTGHEILYIANEQSPEEIKTTAERICVKNIGKIRVVKAMGGLKSPLGDLIQRFKPLGLMILDSLTKLTDSNPDYSTKVCEAFKSFAVELKVPSLIVNQITKEGDHAGVMKIQHAVDATFFLEKDDTTGERFFYSTKNRFGEAPKAIELLMTPADAEVPGMLLEKPKPIKDVARLLGEGQEEEEEEDDDE